MDAGEIDDPSRQQLNMNSSISIPRIGVIGGGHLGRIHAKLASANSQCCLVGVADPLESTRAQIESQLNLPTVSDFKQWSGLVDGVIIATPTFLHHEIGQWCLRHNMHVLVEKPIASNSDQAQELVQLAKQMRRTLQVGHVERFNPAWQLATEQIADQSVRYLEATREGVFTGRSTDIGIVMDLMIHDIDLAMSAIPSQIESVHAYGWSVLGEHEDYAVASLEFKNGSIAHLRASRISACTRRCMQLYTDENLVEVDFTNNTVTNTCPLEDVASKTRQADKLDATERSKVKDRLFQDWLSQRKFTPNASNAIESEQIEFFHAIQSGSSVTVTGQQGSRALEVACQILDAIELHRPESRNVLPITKRFVVPKAA